MEKCAFCGELCGKYPVHIKHSGKEYSCCMGTHADLLWGMITLTDFAKAGAPNTTDHFRPPER